MSIGVSVHNVITWLKSWLRGQVNRVCLWFVIQSSGWPETRTSRGTSRESIPRQFEILEPVLASGQIENPLQFWPAVLGAAR
jgi:hypothetical protein